MALTLLNPWKLSTNLHSKIGCKTIEAYSQDPELVFSYLVTQSKLGIILVKGF